MPVERPTFHESWYRVAELHPRLRSTVQVSRQHFRSQPWFVIQDHSNNAFFRLAEPAYRFIGLLDGTRTVGQAWTMTNEQLGDDAPTQGEAIQLLGQLYTSNLLQAEVPADTHTLFARYKKRRQREIAGYFMNIMFARIPIFDPDAFLNHTLALLGWIFSPVGLVVWLALIIPGILAITQTPGWQEKLLSRRDSILSPENLILLYVAFAMIKACHEMGHAISCKKFGKQAGTGGEVHIIGIMFLVFTPVPYVDASSSWAMTNKWHRAIVGAAGMWVELAIAAVAAMIWANTRDSSTLHNFAFNIMFVAGFSTIVFNANPLLRYDGYYILSDLLEIPNLAQRGKEYIYYLVKRYVWNVKYARNPAYSRSEKVWLFIYAIASFIMRVFVTLSIMFYLTSVLDGALIIIAAGMTIAGLITWALVPVGKFLHYLFTSGELHRVRARAVLTSFAFLAFLVVLFGIVRFPDRSRAQGIVEPDIGGLTELYIGGEGPIQSIDVDTMLPPGTDPLIERLNMPVASKGQLLVQLENPDLQLRQMAQLQADRQRLQVQLRGSYADDPRNAPLIKTQLDAVDDLIRSKREQIDQLTLKSPISGVLITPHLEEKKFAYAKRSDPVGLVVDLHHLVIRAAVPNELSLSLEAGVTRVEFRMEGRPDLLFSGVIAEHVAAGTKDLPSQALAIQAGGTINTAPDDQKGTKAAEHFFNYRIVGLKLIGPQSAIDTYANLNGLPLLPGQRVVVRFDMPSKSLAAQGWIRLRQVFQKKFQM